ncbi:hypothetical protein AB0451_24270 [Streptomyces sp. NPDC052000]
MLLARIQPSDVLAWLATTPSRGVSSTMRNQVIGTGDIGMTLLAA